MSKALPLSSLSNLILKECETQLKQIRKTNTISKDILEEITDHKGYLLKIAIDARKNAGYHSPREYAENLGYKNRYLTITKLENHQRPFVQINYLDPFLKHYAINIHALIKSYKRINEDKMKTRNL